MPATRRPLILAVLLALGAVAQLLTAGPASAASRWPATAAVFDVPGWSAGAAGIGHRGTTAFVSRRYMSADGRVGAVLGIVTSADAKNVYRAGPEVPFAGAGYAISTPPDSLAASGPDRIVFLATRGRDRMIVFAAHGERRGLVGNGPLGWALATIDGLLGRPNDYFEATLVVPLDGVDDAAAAREGGALADRVFAQIAAWYAR